MKKIIFFIILFFFSLVYAQSKPEAFDDDIKIFMQAKISFNSNEFNDSLHYAELAKQNRKNKISSQSILLENSFKPAEVKYAGDSISTSLKILEERQDYDAIQIINWYQKIKGSDFFNDSKKNLLDYIKSLAAFPEADFLIGKIYKVEGEYDIAVKYFNVALENAKNLDIPDEKYDILYELANLYSIQGKTEQYEKYLLLILAQDTVFQDRVLIDAMKKTISNESKNCLEKFFQLYRIKNANTLKAYFEIADYYRKNNSPKALEASMIGVLTAFSKIDSVFQKRNPEYTYKDLKGFFEELKNYPDIIEWGMTNKVWQGFFNLAIDAHGSHYMSFTLQMLDLLRSSAPEQYWREKAYVKLEELLG
ncbi:MAG: hypothetical protein II098_04375 [Treponema sp.]|nr:hypothetical protein [Treponema sp.]